MYIYIYVVVVLSEEEEEISLCRETKQNVSCEHQFVLFAYSVM